MLAVKLVQMEHAKTLELLAAIKSGEIDVRDVQLTSTGWQVTPTVRPVEPEFMTNMELINELLGRSTFTGILYYQVNGFSWRWDSRNCDPVACVENLLTQLKASQP